MTNRARRLNIDRFAVFRFIRGSGALLVLAAACHSTGADLENAMAKMDATSSLRDVICTVSAVRDGGSCSFTLSLASRASLISNLGIERLPRREELRYGQGYLEFHGQACLGNDDFGEDAAEKTIRRTRADVEEYWHPPSNPGWSKWISLFPATDAPFLRHFYFNGEHGCVDIDLPSHGIAG